MKVQILSFHCVLKNRLGQVLSTSFNQEVINQLEEGSGNLRALVAGLQDLTAGERRQVKVSAEEAYGLYDPSLVVEVRRSELLDGSSLSVGNEILRSARPEGQGTPYRVIHADESSITLDGNHPLAGQDLIFDIEVVAAREAIGEDFSAPDETSPERYLH